MKTNTTQKQNKKDMFTELSISSFNKVYKPKDTVEYTDEEGKKREGVVWAKAYKCEKTQNPVVKVLVKHYTGVAILNVSDIDKLIKHNIHFPKPY